MIEVSHRPNDRSEDETAGVKVGDGKRIRLE
jgi:hypothetical protein